MTDRAPQLDRQVTRLPDGRQLIYYPFPGADAPPAEAPAPAAAPAPGAATPPPPPREER
jgi:hypothetical protein